MNASVVSLERSVRLPADLTVPGPASVPSGPAQGDGCVTLPGGLGVRMSSEDEAVRETLGHLGRKGRRFGPGRWQIALAEGGSTWVNLTIDAEWLFLGVALPASLLGRTPASLPWPLLLRNAALPWPVRYALAGHRVVLRADVLRCPGEGSSRGLKECLNALEAASVPVPHLARTRFGGEGAERSLSHTSDPRTSIGSPMPPATRAFAALGSSSTDAAPSGSLSMDELLSLCRAGGWDAVVRGETLAVALGASGGPPTSALIVPTPPNGGAGVSVEFESVENLTPASRAAIALFLLSTTCALRLVRAEVVETGNSCGIRLEARIPGPVTAADLGDALSALSVGFQTCAAEVSALAEVSLATDYLRIRGWPADDTQTNNP